MISARRGDSHDRRFIDTCEYDPSVSFRSIAGTHLTGSQSPPQIDPTPSAHRRMAVPMSQVWGSRRRNVTTYCHWCSPDGRDAVRFILTLATVPTAPTSRFYTNATAQTKHN